MASFEARVFPPGSQFFRGGSPPASQDYQFYTTAEWGMAYLDRAININDRGPLKFTATFVTQPLCLFVMSHPNFTLLDDPEIASKLRRTMVEVVGYDKLTQSLYQRFAVSHRGDPINHFKTQPQDTLQIHTHHFLNRKNRNAGDYAALSLAKQLKTRLQTLGFDGWIYPEDTTAKRASTSRTNMNAPTWNTAKITDTP